VHTIPLLAPAAASDLLAQAQRLEYVDGKASARGASKDVKANLQARRSGEEFEALAAAVLTALSSDGRVRDVAFPRRLSRPLVNRYEGGGTYGLHVDSAFMGGVDEPLRTDLSYTLFLTPPDDYEGGVLQVAGESGMREVKAAPGTLVIYPTYALHQVTPVTSGSRVSIVGWIESWLPDPTYRALMTKVRQVQSALEDEKTSAMSRLLMTEVAEGLLRYGSR
jgi:PKHD-type hydroxylase